MWRQDISPEGDPELVYGQPELGVAASALKGTANLQNVNISTQSGAAMASFARTAQQQTALSAQTMTAYNTTLLDAPATLKAGTWVTVSASTVTSISATTSPTTASIDYLVVGGGGAGGYATASGAGGGGGAGQVVAGSTSVSVASYAVTVGAGGVAQSLPAIYLNGSNSSLGGLVTAIGGGGGGSGDTTNLNGNTGGSGGGAGGHGATLGTAGTGTAGFNGGSAVGTVNDNEAGGGGGAGAVGDNGYNGTSPTNGGNGGVGVTSSITGTLTYYGGGGGGGARASATSSNSGGQGGGGRGGNVSTSGGAAGISATANTGGGGGGAGVISGNSQLGGNGGSGIVVIRYLTGSMVATGGKISFFGAYTIHTFTSSDVFTVVDIAKTNIYFVSYKDTNNRVKLSSKFDPTASNVITHGSTGTVTFSTLAVPNQGIAKAVETYTTASTEENRYYVLDANARVWVYDTAVYTSTLAASGVGTTWMLPDPLSYSSLAISGMAILNGWLMCVSRTNILGKPTVNLGGPLYQLYNAYLMDPFSTHTNYAMTGSQGSMYYCDGNYIGQLFPTTSLVTSIANIQSYCQYTGSSTTGTISQIIGGSLPYSPDGTRIPVVFFTDVNGTLPTNVFGGTVYYLQYLPFTKTFNIYTTLTGTTLVDIGTGASGNQFFSTFYPISADAGINGTNALVQYTPQRLNLPFYETANCLVEIGNTVLVGCQSNIVYPWNQVDALPSDLIALPENNVKTMINVNNTAYIFAGDKANIYISNGSVASLALKIPDYAAGVPGTVTSYIDPTFTWGDAAYIRGRVYFSILDQTATKAGNCGGVWSFVPTQNLYIGQDIGMSLRLENQNSYGTYNGYANLLITNQNQSGNSPKYWSIWQDSYNTGSANFGIDYSTENPVTQYIVETDLLPTGTYLQKKTFNQLEFKLATPLVGSDSVQLYWRTNATDTWTSAGTLQYEASNPIAGFYNIAFQKTQWTQIRAVVTTSGSAATSSFVPLIEIRLK